MTKAASDPAPARSRRVLAVVAVALGLGVLVLIAGLYAARRQIAREAVTDWLRSNGVASESSFSELGPGHLVGRIRIGPAAAPDLTVDRAEVTYSLAGLIAGRGVEVTSIRLVRPVLKARWKDGRFSAGALDPLIEQFRRRPPRPGAPSPRIEIDDGRIALATEYGVLRASADALIDNARLVRLSAATQPMHARAAGLQADLGAGAVRATTMDGRISGRLRAPILRASLSDGAKLRDGALNLAVEAAYPDLRRRPASSGQATAELSAASVEGHGASGRDIRLQARSAWSWSAAQPAELSGDLRVSGTTSDVVAGDLRLATVAADFAGAYWAAAQSSVRLSGNLDARGGWSGLGAPARDDSPEIAALKRGLRAFRASAEGVELAADGKGVHAGLAGPARLLPDTGGQIRLSPHRAGYQLAMAGGGLPRLDADIRSFGARAGQLTATGTVKAALSIGPLQDGVYDAAGTLRLAAGQASFLASRCAEVKAARLDLGANAAENLRAAVCPSGQPLLRVGGDGWSLAGRVERASAAAPFLQATLGSGAGQVRLAAAGRSLSARIEVSHAGVRDAAASPRFRPLVMSGAVKLDDDRWTGELGFRLPSGPQVGRATLRQDAKTGAGAVEVATGPLQFRPGGLQPGDITPIVQSFATAVQGRAEFSGVFRWTASGGKSGGELKLADLDFKSPIGAVAGLSGEVHLTSLSPLIAPPGQIVHAARVAAALPLTDVSASLALQEKALVVARAEGSAGGGKLRITALDVPLEPRQPLRGVLQFEGVQLHDLVEASPFGDRVDLDARVTGRVPFEAQDGKIRVTAGELHAIAPGRLSIQRAALTGLTAQGAVEAPAAAAAPAANTDTFTDFAYQALENLAFSSLDARIDTHPDGRLGVLFHILGFNDPPKHQEITLSWWDLVRRKFIGKKLPLPSGTGVDLTLDTTLNLDDLLQDYADFERLKGSGQVQR